MRDIRFELAIVLKSSGRFRSRKALIYVGQQYILAIGVKMETSTPGKRGLIAGRFNNPITILLAVVVTIDVSLTIARHWKTYDWLGRFLGIVLLLNLVIVPLTIVIKSSKGEKPKPDMLVQTAYIWVLLATMLFSR
jgi:hypothetical protein